MTDRWDDQITMKINSGAAGVESGCYLELEPMEKVKDKERARGNTVGQVGGHTEILKKRGGACSGKSLGLRVKLLCCILLAWSWKTSG